MPDESADVAAREERARSDSLPGAFRREGQWYVNASALSASVRKLVLKDNDAFLVTDRRCDFPATMPGEFGYYCRGTRYLSTMEVRIQDDLPLVLEAGHSDDDMRLVSELTNARLLLADGRILPPSSLHLRREVVLEDDVLFEKIGLRNYSSETVELELEIAFDADFVDMFEVRGSKRPARGTLRPAKNGPRGTTLAYEGLDRVLRTTEIDIEPAADEWRGQRFLFRLRLEPARSDDARDQEIRVRMRPSETPLDVAASVAARAKHEWLVPAPLVDPVRGRLGGVPSLKSDHASLNRLLDRAVADVVTMLSMTPHGLYPYAGIPWYCAPFGRDGSITALELLPWMPEVARGVLEFQAAHQARDADDFTDREPGKILHEMRWGEMAALREIPFIPYYGAVDSTPLFLVLLAEFVRVTDDVALLEKLWPNALRALAWIDEHGDLDGDGFIEYASRSPKGLRNQGWKDSSDGIAHADGALAEVPVAVCEAQAYVVLAWRGVARLAELLGELERAADLRARADRLQRGLHEAYWIEDLDAFALALDRDKRPCRVLTTNAGHVLWAGAAEPDVGRRLARRLVQPDLSSGFGLRTLQTGAPRYSPLSYHNGSIWPHDNALVAEGLRAYGAIDSAVDVFTGVVQALERSSDGRVPELYCGFARGASVAPVPYPVACSPQAWSSAAMLQLVRTLLGLSVDGRERVVRFDHPVLPKWMQWLEVRGLPAAGGALDFLAIRGRSSCAIEVLSKPAGLTVLVRG